MSAQYRDHAAAIEAEVKKTMFGLDRVIRLLIVAYYTDGHVLLEGNPGVGKTALVNALSKAMKLDFKRIQFTPDLMPADITGTYMPSFENSTKFEFRHGPIFSNIVLADEINRATPKTQSAMLEAMAEQQVTVLGITEELPAPFMVMATQNPIDHEGTYDLPEAQADRFMFKVLMENPPNDTLRLIFHKVTGAMATELKDGGPPENPLAGKLAKDTAQAQAIHAEISDKIRDIPPLPTVEAHIINMIAATNREWGAIEKLGQRAVDDVKRLTDATMRFGLGPRAGIALLNAAKAMTLLFTDGATHAVGESLVPVSKPALRHRIKLDFDWESHYRPDAREALRGGKIRSEDLREQFMDDLILATAPDIDGYRESLSIARPQQQVDG